MFLGQVQWFESRDVDEVLNISSKVIGKLSSGEKGHQPGREGGGECEDHEGEGEPRDEQHGHAWRP